MDADYVEEVLALVEAVPAGRVTTYGTVARLVGRAGPRQVGRVLSEHGDATAWWRVVHADGRAATCHDGGAAELLSGEGTPRRSSGVVDLEAAQWYR